MDKNELKTQVQKVVDELFSAKEEADIRKKTEAALQESADTIKELTTALEGKNSEVAELEEKMSENEATIEDLKSKLEAAKKESEDKDAKLEDELKKKDEEIAKLGDTHKEELETVTQKLIEQSAKIRMAEIEEAGVCASDKEAQEEKVKAMSDEEFAAYKDELISIREAVVEELAKSGKKKEEEEEDEDEKKKKKKEEDKKKSKASLNLETSSNDDVMSKYAEMGKAMASKFVKKDK